MDLKVALHLVPSLAVAVNLLAVITAQFGPHTYTLNFFDSKMR